MGTRGGRQATCQVVVLVAAHGRDPRRGGYNTVNYLRAEKQLRRQKERTSPHLDSLLHLTLSPSSIHMNHRVCCDGAYRAYEYRSACGMNTMS